MHVSPSREAIPCTSTYLVPSSVAAPARHKRDKRFMPTTQNKTTKSMVLNRMKIIKDTSCELYNVVLEIINKGVKMGVLKDE